MPERGAALPPAGARLLVVDDNKVNRMLLARSLELEGHRVSTAQDGREALELLQREPFDLVLLDMEMPEVDGFTVLETLQADAELREVPVIVTSSLEGVEHVARCIELGADDFLQKPVHPVLLKARVGSSLAKKRQRDLRREELQRELAHQVAERSRALGDAFARATPAPASLAPRSRFGARYEVVRSLGEGGMGAVFEVERATDGARLALKVMTGQVSRVAAARFAREAEIGARLRDPHLVSIVDVGVTDTGTPFLVMELVTGGSLEGRRASFGDVAFAVPVLRQVARGLSALHSAGVVHRDLKPSNVLLDARGAAKVSDFGLARFADHLLPTAPTAEGAAVTRPGAWLGTPLYMAPEAVASAGEVTPAADVFALGILAYELLSGASPFATPPVLLASAGQPLPVPLPLAQPPGEARAVLRACLSEEPARRPLIAEVLAALG